MKNREIADLFTQMADLMEILGQDSFRVNSYRKAARIVGELARPIEDLAAAGELTTLPGIGKSTAQKIEAYLKTGSLAQLEELKAQAPEGLLDLLRLSGLGPKTAMRLWKEAGITSLRDLQQAFEKQDERLALVHGLGPKKMRQLWESLMFIQSAGSRVRLGDADAVMADLVASIAAASDGGRVVPAGSFRRGRETVGDLDLLAEADARRAEQVVHAFTAASNVRKIIAAGPTKASVLLTGGLQVDLRVVPADSFGSALAYFTGSKSHNVRLREIALKKGLKLNEYGLFDGERRVAGQDEESIYKVLDLPFIEPELREDAGEIEAARAGALPRLVRLEDIRADFHMHTVASDGACTIDEMIQACRKRGYRCMAICDHSASEVQANGLKADRLLQHVQDIRQAAKACKDITVLAGSEVDILKDGSLDYDDSVLAELDFVVASCHSHLSMAAPEATPRIIRAIEHRYVNCIGHPSGRLINARAGMEIDIARIAQAAAANDVALEINAHYMRLDLRDTHVRAAVQAGARIVINSDAHNAEELSVMRFGVTTARRGWATPDDVINTWPVKRIRQFLARKR